MHRTRFAVAGIVASMPALAAAAPIADKSADLGDGKPEQLELAADGSVHVGAAPAIATTSGARVTGGSIDVGRVRGKPAIAVTATTAHGVVGAIVVRAGAQWKLAWQGDLGPVGVDGDYSLALAAGPAAIVRYQSRPGWVRCDGASALLFAEEFDGNGFVRAKSLPVGVTANAPAIATRTDTDAATAPLAWKARLVSADSSATTAGELAAPTELDDGDPATAWLVPAPAVGEFATFRPRSADATASQLRVVLPARGARPRELAIIAQAGAWRVELPDAAHAPPGAALIVDLPTPIRDCATIAIAATADATTPVELAELELFAPGERAGGAEAAAAKLVAADGPGAEATAAALARRGAPAVAAIDAELRASHDAGARQRLVRVLAQIHDPSAAPVLAHAATEGWVSGDDLLAIVAALADANDVGALGALATSATAELEVRIAAVRALPWTVAAANGVLTALAGTGPRELRRAVIEKLARVPASGLATAAQASTRDAQAGDVWQAAIRWARAHADDRANLVAAMRAAWQAAGDPASAYERRNRLAGGIALLGDAPALAALQAALAAPSADRAALREVVAHALAAEPRPDAAELLLALAADDSPGVRVAALSAAMTREPWGATAAARIDLAIADRLARDGWPDVRVRAAQALGQRCDQPAPAAALIAALGADGDRVVRGEAMAALVQCRARGVGELLAKTWRDDKAPLDLRTRAISLAIELGDRNLGAALVGEFASWRAHAIDHEESLALAASAANAIARLDAPGAAAALLDALDDAAFPDIVGAAATALGTLGPACPAAAKAKLAQLAASDEPQISVPARHAVATCGRRSQ